MAVREGMGSPVHEAPTLRGSGGRVGPLGISVCSLSLQISLYAVREGILVQLIHKEQNNTDITFSLMVGTSHLEFCNISKTGAFLHMNAFLAIFFSVII
jgi:hypothetical protein